MFPDNTLDTSDWETYRNEEFGFEVRYPRDWDISVRSAKEIREENSSVDYSDTLIGVVLFDTNEPYSSFYVWAYNHSVDTVLKKQERPHFIDPGPGPVKETIINGVKTYYFLRHDESEAHLGVYYLGDSNRGYEISHTTGDDNEATFQQILFTFKLIK